MNRKNKIWAKLFGIAILSFSILLLLAEIAVAVLNEIITSSSFGGYSITLIIVPVVSLCVTIIIVMTVYNTNRKSNILIESLERVASGDYSTAIEVRKGDSFSEVYENFNKMTKELNSVKTLREEFVHSLSHDFKTPLCSIHGFASLLLEGGVEPEDEKKYLKIIADEADRLRELAEGVLTLSKLENQQMLGESKPFRLDAQIRDCVILLEKSWAEKEIDIDLNLENVVINGDETTLKRVWTNLISNAVKFTPKGGKIDIYLKKSESKIVVCVTDNGPGVNSDDINKIFDKYYRSPQAKGIEGNGLGLAICKRICTLYGGEIFCQSTEGKGACFTVTLPV